MIQASSTSLSGRIALVTGGSRGLGKETALAVAARGGDAIITYRQEQEAANAVVAAIESKGQKAAALQLDMGNAASFGDFFGQLTSVLQAKWGREQFDALINNAGVGGYAMIGTTPEETLDQMFNVHFKGVYLLTQQALPLIADGGRIVNISSGLTRFSFPGYAAYASMKGAIEVFTRYLAKELGARNITANCVAPGAIDNDFNKHAFEGNPQIKNIIAGNTALGRVGVSEDIGGLVAFLCAEEARWVTGQRIEASGGMFI